MKKRRFKNRKQKPGQHGLGAERQLFLGVPEVSGRRLTTGPGVGPALPVAPAEKKSRRRPSLRLDGWRLAGAVVRGWPWLLAGAAACALAGFFFGSSNAEYAAGARLIHTQAPALLNASLVSETFRPKEPALETFLEAVKSEEVLRRVADAPEAGLKPIDVVRRCEVRPAASGEFIDLQFRDPNPAQAVQAVNRLAGEVARASRQLQADEFNDLGKSLKERLATLDSEFSRAGQELIQFQRENGSIDYDLETSASLQQQETLDLKAQDLQLQLDTVDLQTQSLTQEVAKQNPALVAARSALAKALERYTDDHPKVKQLRAALSAAEAEAAAQENGTNADVASWSSPLVNALYQQIVDLRTRKIALTKQLAEAGAAKKKLQENLASLPEKQLACARIKARYQSLKSQRDRLAQHERDCRLLADSTVGFYRVFQPARLEDAGRLWKWKAGLGTGAGAGLLGMFAVGLGLIGRELADGRIRSERDLTRVTGLPLLATLGDLSKMTDREKELWAFRTLKVLHGKLNQRSDQALVCGFISATSGEGRSTWVTLLADAARKQGHRVLVVSGEEYGRPDNSSEAASRPEPASTVAGVEPAVSGDFSPALLPAPAQSAAHFSFRDWVWDPARRQQWQGLLQQWDALDHVMVFVELPPASAPEAILLAERLPKVLWICSKDMASVSETRSHMETLRCSRCNLAGVVFNRAAVSPWRKRFAHLAGGLAIAAALLSNGVAAEPTNSSPAGTNVLNPSASLSITSPDQLADWQKRLTLGAGDVLDIGLYEEADSGRAGLFIGPDGRLNYLEARDVEAAGLTVDELRKRLEEVLAKYHRVPRVVIRPVAYNSKKYYVLGNVQQSGVFSLSRPVTIVEGVARAGGFQTSAQHRNALVQADLTRSFLVRSEADGTFKRIPVDFEALFLRGELNQNMGLAPGDYLFFPPIDLQEVYVLGEVRSPGNTAFTKDMTALGAIVSRGSFTDRAFKGKVLVVRGSLNSPQSFVVDVNAILSAKGKDFPLQNKDIVYVSRRPFVKAEELTESAIMSFVNGLTYGWVQGRLIPQLPRP